MEKANDMQTEKRKESRTVSLDGFRHMGNSCSVTDCTGLIPSLPSSEAELEAYEEMYQFCASKPDEP